MSLPHSRKRSIFVTVGTTLFEALVEAVTRPDALQWMASAGYTDLIVQYGKGQKPDICSSVSSTSSKSSLPIKVRLYDFAPNLKQDMVEADLVISHAGAGTVMEALRLGKRLAVVINTMLMDNHQTELASAMGSRGYMYVVEGPSDLINPDFKTWKAIDSYEPVQYEGGDEFEFPRALDAFMGFADASPKED